MNCNVFPMDKVVVIDDNILLFLKSTKLTIHTRVFIQNCLKKLYYSYILTRGVLIKPGPLRIWLFKRL